MHAAALRVATATPDAMSTAMPVDAKPETSSADDAKASTAAGVVVPLRLRTGLGTRMRRGRDTARFAAWAGVAALALLSACTTPPGRTPPPIIESPTVPPPVAAPPVAAAKPLLVPTSWSALPGWSSDALTEAWPAFLASCDALARKSEWTSLCLSARRVDGADALAVRNFFESRFVPNRVTTTDGNDIGLVTGYYEPLLRGSRVPVAPYLTPVYGVPDDLLVVDLSSLYPELKGKRVRGRLVGRTVVPYPTRGELAGSGALRGRELLWVDDPIEAFFLEIQGSGRVALYRGGKVVETVRLAYADQNGQPYRSIGRWLVDRGEMTLSQASMQSIKGWAVTHPQRLDELLAANPSEVFFKAEPIVDPSKGPKGALGVSLTPQRSIAVDPRVVPLGSPVFLATSMPTGPSSAFDAPLQRLVMAQDTGGAIAAAPGAAVRADYFWGFGAEAGNQAGRMKQDGRMWVLLPR